MAAASVQFAVATHIMTSLGFHYGGEVKSSTLAESVNAEPTFVRRSISKLAKAGLVTTTRGRHGFCALTRPPERITLRDIYLASEAPSIFAVHGYPVQKACPISSNMKRCMSTIQAEAQRKVEETLAQTTLADAVADIRRGTRRKK